MNICKLLSAFVFSLMLGLLTGCTSLSLKKPDIWPLNIEDNKPGMPSQVVANWTDTILYEGNQVPVRGFGGRLIFYIDGKKDPVKIEGTLAVYAFDEKNRDLGNVKPDRKFVFTKDQLATHYSKSKLGHSYSVWIPWDDAGGEQKEISLIVRFMPEKGNVVVSEQTKHILPGKTTEQAVVSNLPPFNPNSSTIQRVSYESPTAQANLNGSRRELRGCGPQSMTTTTIAIPPSSILRQQPTSAGTNNGVYYPQATPSSVAPNAMSNTQMPFRQVPSMQGGAAQNASVQPIAGIAENPSFGGHVNSTNAWGPQNPVGLPPNRFGPGQYRVPGAPFSPSMPSHAPLQPSPSGPGFGPGASSAPATGCGFAASPEGAGSPMN